MQIRSLRQLVLGSFVVALVPLAALLWQSQHDLNKLSNITTNNTAFFVSTVSNMSNIESTAIDIERLIRQHFVYPNITLKQLNDQTLIRFRHKQALLCDALSLQSVCEQLELHMVVLENYPAIADETALNEQLSVFQEAVVVLREQVNSAVFERVKQQEAHLETVQQTHAWSTAILVLLSLILIVTASNVISKPVRKLQTIIDAIAHNLPELPVKSSTGPREILAVERDLFVLHSRIQQLEKVRIALLRHAAHELKTPLASMKEGCSLLSEELAGPLNERQHEIMLLLNQSNQRLSLLIEKLLDYNNLLQQAQPSFEYVDSAEIIEECVAQNRLILQQNNMDVDIHIDQQEAKIITDPELFRRILDNLISNAIAHGQVDTLIDIRMHGSRMSVVLDVANQGKAINAADRVDIFEPFKRGDGARNDRVMGAGLGLSIVSDCVRLLGGVVNIAEVDYAPVCFRVKLPKQASLS